MTYSIQKAVWCFLLTSLLTAGLSFPDATVDYKKKTTSIPEQSIKGTRYFRLDSVAEAVGARVRVEGKKTRNVFIDLDGRTVTLTTRKTMASADGFIIDLKAPVEEVRKDIYVPESFMTTALPRLLDARIVVDADRKAYRAVEGRAVDVSVDYRSFRDRTRIVFRLSERVPFTITQPPGRIVLRMTADGVQCGAASVSIDDGAVRTITFRGAPDRGTFEVLLGSSFKEFKSSEMSDPFRVVLDVGRSDTYKAAAAEGEPRPTPRPEATPELQPAPESPAPGNGQRSFRQIVLDPGHGGREPGAKGPTGLLEKDVTLAVAGRLAQLLKTKLGLDVLLTRDADTDVPLQDRTALANTQKADLFLSLHCNASFRENARGAETYFMSYQAADLEAAALARLENNPDDPDREPAPLPGDLQLILWDMAQSEYLQESEKIAEVVNFELCQTLDIQDRGVKQAPFAVLAGASMPAVLVEIAFISNPVEERELKTDEFQIKIATALYKAIVRFRNSHDLKRGLAP